MKLNSNTKVLGSNVILVPYEQHHVPKYHMWMKSEELQKLTASEPLSLEEEYNMQKSWREDEDTVAVGGIIFPHLKFAELKIALQLIHFIIPAFTECTFIILLKEKLEKGSNEIDAMIGDTNIFITDSENQVGEIEIMIAEKSAQGKGLGWETVVLMLVYGIEYIGLKVYEAKISLCNNKSIQMFKKLGFVEKSKSEVFQEITFEKRVNNEWTEWLKKQYSFNIKNII